MKGIEKVVGVEGFPIYDQVFGKGSATYRQKISIAPLAILYFLSQFYTFMEVLASLFTPSSGQWLLANNTGDKLRSCCQFSGVLVPDSIPPAPISSRHRTGKSGVA